jgi:hypothetical protein
MKLLQWVLIIPVFKKLIDIVDQKTIYLVLMNLFFILSLVWVAILYLGKGIRIDPKIFREKITKNIIISISAILLLTWVFLVSDLFFYIRENQVSPMMESIANTPFCFAFFYCLFGPLLFGICLSVLVQTIVVGISNTQKK